MSRGQSSTFPVHSMMSGRNFTLFFTGEAPAAGYAIEVSSGRLFRNGELWGRVESIKLDAFTTVRHVVWSSSAAARAWAGTLGATKPSRPLRSQHEH